MNNSCVRAQPMSVVEKINAEIEQREHELLINAATALTLKINAESTSSSSNYENAILGIIGSVYTFLAIEDPPTTTSLSNEEIIAKLKKYNAQAFETLQKRQIGFLEVVSQFAKLSKDEFGAIDIRVHAMFIDAILRYLSAWSQLYTLLSNNVSSNTDLDDINVVLRDILVIGALGYHFELTQIDVTALSSTKSQAGYMDINMLLERERQQNRLQQGKITTTTTTTRVSSPIIDLGIWFSNAIYTFITVKLGISCMNAFLIGLLTVDFLSPDIESDLISSNVLMWVRDIGYSTTTTTSVYNPLVYYSSCKLVLRKSLEFTLKTALSRGGNLVQEGVSALFTFSLWQVICMFYIYHYSIEKLPRMYRNNRIQRIINYDGTKVYGPKPLHTYLIELRERREAGNSTIVNPVEELQGQAKLIKYLATT